MNRIIEAATPSDAFLVLTNVPTTEMQVFNGIAGKPESGGKIQRLGKAKTYDNQ